MKRTSNFTNNIIRVVSVLIIAICVVSTFLQITSKRSTMRKTEQIIDLIYKYQDINTLVINAEVLEDMCEPEIFTILDNRSKANVTRRFNKYITTIPSIKNITVDGDSVIAIVAMNTESELRDRLIKITYDKNGLVHDYKEYEFVNKFDMDYNFAGDFDAGRATDYQAGEGEDSVLNLEDSENEDGLTDVATKSVGD